MAVDTANTSTATDTDIGTGLNVISTVIGTGTSIATVTCKTLAITDLE